MVVEVKMQVLSVEAVEIKVIEESNTPLQELKLQEMYLLI